MKSVVEGTSLDLEQKWLLMLGRQHPSYCLGGRLGVVSTDERLGILDTFTM